ncbi:hypothetical protein EI200_04955 [Peribacillus simplex]|nr:hypothetical protein EI200_04955 [Peribacillus simplex]
MDVDFHFRHSLSAGGPGASSACACGVSPRLAFPAGVSHLPFHQLCYKIKISNKEETKEIKQSTTDRESGYYVKRTKQFAYSFVFENQLI